MSSVEIPPLPFPPDHSGGTSQSPLSPEQFAEIERAHLRGKKIRRAVSVAKVDAWCSAVFGGLTVLSAIFSPISLTFGVALCVTAFNSFRGLHRLKRIDSRGPRLLALNQLWLAGIILLYAAYCIWSIWPGHGGGGTGSSAEDAEIKQLPLEYQQIFQDAQLALYIGLIAATLVTQGLAAWYYATRKKYFAAYLRDTPQWIVDLQKKQAAP